jgi:hypothetical protein
MKFDICLPKGRLQPRLVCRLEARDSFLCDDAPVATLGTMSVGGAAATNGSPAIGLLIAHQAPFVEHPTFEPINASLPDLCGIPTNCSPQGANFNVKCPDPFFAGSSAMSQLEAISPSPHNPDRR